MRSPDLLGIVSRGASLRRRRFLKDLGQAAIPIAIAAVLQAAIYTWQIVDAGRSDWQNLAITASALALVPLVSVAILISVGRQEFPITSATVVAAIMFNFAVAILSALRIAVSYTGMLCAAPIALICVIYVSVRLHNARHERVAVLAFPRASELKVKLGGRAVIIDSPDVQVANVDRVLIDGETHHNPRWSAFLTRLHMLGVEVTPWFRYMEARFGHVDIGSFDITHLAYSQSQIYYSQLKRLFDLFALLVLSPIVLPLCLLFAGYIWVIDGSPVLFRQRRRGYGGSEFTMLKFRTMIRDADGNSASENDSRVIPRLRLLREMRLDELPQLVNILRGDMSFIGPRPIAVPIATALETALPQYQNRHLVLPGLTGWAQVSHGYASTHDQEVEKLAYDLYYVKALSFDLDLLILIKTIRIVLLRIGAR